jgi:hypothetical protein
MYIICSYGIESKVMVSVKVNGLSDIRCLNFYAVFKSKFFLKVGNPRREMSIEI